MNLDGFRDNVNIVPNDEQSNLEYAVTDEESKIKTFRVKNYIPKRSTEKLLKFSHIIGITIIIVLISIIILLACFIKKKIIDNTSAEIVVSDGNRFWMYNPQTGSLKHIWEVKHSTQELVMDARKTLYWIETNSWKIFSFNFSETESVKNESLLFEGTRANPLRKPSMALDSIYNNLYIVDESIEGFVVINIETKYYALMTVDLVNPRYIVLDAAKGVMFVGSTTWIKRADMNGDNLMPIIYSTSISSLTLDPEEERIYWVLNSEVIESSDYSGKHEQQLAIELDYFVDLTFLDDHLFWLRKSSDTKHRIIWSCKVHNGVCINHTEHSNAVGNAVFIKATAFSQNNSSRQNSSKHQNCQHITLPIPGGRVSCACNMSFQLFYDTTCKPITKFILYTMGGYIRARTLDALKKVILEPIWPTPYHNDTSLQKTTINFDYDFENDDFYFSDDNKIYKIKLKGTDPQQEVVFDSQDNFYVGNLAYDWLSENMYYVKISKSYHSEISIVVFNVKKGAEFQKILTKFDSRTNNMNSFALITYPRRGFLYLAALQRRHSYALRHFSVNGTLITAFNERRYSKQISIDYEVDRLYWIEGYTLKCANLNGTKYTTGFDLSRTLLDMKFFSIDGQWIYIFPSDSVKIYRINKNTGVHSDFASPLTYRDGIEPSGVRIINQVQIKENPCRIHNGGCEHFCFFGLNVTCGCADGFLGTSKGLCSRT